MNVGQYMNLYKEDMIRTLGELVAYPSVSSGASIGKPFGEENRAALDYVLNKAAEFDLNVFDADGFAGHAEYGDGDEIAAVLAHIDVVPAGDNWQTDPFVLTEKNGVLYGRGVSDDKGPAVMALYALKMLKEQSIKTDRKLRVIFGCSEETSPADMEHYFEKTQIPNIAFTPDVGFPIINREKGRLVYKFFMPYDGNTVIRSIDAGNAPNMVIDRCKAVLNIANYENCKIDSRVAVDLENGNLVLNTIGKASHGAAPQNGINAASLMLPTLLQFAENEKVHRFIRFLSDCIAKDCDGTAIGIQSCDNESGALTLNFGMFKIDNGQCEATIDIRYPITKSGRGIVLALNRAAKAYGIFGDVIEHKAPLAVDSGSELVRKLSDAYETFKGVPSIPAAIGGGTYARSMPNGTCVGFGGAGAGAHEANESVKIDKFMECAEIVAQAMYNISMK